MRVDRDDTGLKKGASAPFFLSKRQRVARRLRGKDKAGQPASAKRGDRLDKKITK